MTKLSSLRDLTLNHIVRDAPYMYFSSSGKRSLYFNIMCFHINERITYNAGISFSTNVRDELTTLLLYKERQADHHFVILRRLNLAYEP